MEVTVLSGQGLFDVAIQHAGSAIAVFDIAALNGMDITDEPEAGTVLVASAVYNKGVARYYAANGICPATGLSNI